MPKGPVIGSMFIAGALIDEKDEQALRDLGVRDSKMISPKKREFLEKEIKGIAKEWHTVEVTAELIDSLRKKMSLNEVEALKIAELLELFKIKPDLMIIDLPDPTEASFVRRISKYTDSDVKIKAEHKAEDKFPPVGAASILAKTARDRSVRELEKETGHVFGSGYPSDPQTQEFIKNHATEECKFIRHSWITARRSIKPKTQKKLAEF
ncbi:MAG: ribonuclease HII [Candidatus Micrarchaeota archaeon]